MIHKEILTRMLKAHTARYIVVKTKYTDSHIEVLMGSQKDRGRYKWIAESNNESWDNLNKDPEARRSHIDGGDLFPRVFFLADSLINELFTWIQTRDLTITDIEVPKI